MKHIRRKIDIFARWSLFTVLVCFFSFGYLLKRSVNTLFDFVWICFKNICESDHYLHFPTYSIDTNWRYIPEYFEFGIICRRRATFYILQKYTIKWSSFLRWRLEFTEWREQGVWGEATHTGEMCVDARLTKSGNEAYSKENRYFCTSIIIYRFSRFGFYL